jgi:RNA polymerase sigma-70 factor, ECF subfamily
MNMTDSSTQFVVRETAVQDLDLVHATQNGDVTAFDQLVRRYDQNLFRISQTITHNREDSQDAVHETFLSAFQHLNGFRESASFSAWLIRIVVNQVSDEPAKAKQNERGISQREASARREKVPIEIADWIPNPEERYQVAELRVVLARALQALRPSDRTVLVLRDTEGLSIGLSCAAVKSRLFQGPHPTARNFERVLPQT